MMFRTRIRTLNPVVVYIALSRLIGALGFSISMPFLALYLHQELQIKPSVIGGMLTTGGLLGAFFSQIGGRLSDSLGRKHLLILLLGIRSFSFLLLAYLVWSHRSFGWFSLFYIISALFGTSIFPVMDAIVADVTPSSRRDSAYSLTRAAANLGWGIGPAIGGILVIGGYWRLFLMTSLLVFGSLVLIKWKIPETTNNTDNLPKSDRTVALQSDAKLRLFIAFYILMGVVRGQLISTLSIFASDYVGLDRSQIGLLFTVNGLMVAIFQLIVTHITKRWEPLGTLLFAGFLYAIGYFLVGWSINFLMLIFSVAVITIGEMVESPTAASFVSRLSPPHRLGEYMGVYNMGLHLGWTVGPLIGGFLLDITSQPWEPWTILAILALMSGLGFKVSSSYLQSTSH